MKFPVINVWQAELISFPLTDCPQVQCVHPYVAQQPDELSLELADVLNILEKTDDGKSSKTYAESCPTSIAMEHYFICIIKDGRLQYI